MKTRYCLVILALAVSAGLGALSAADPLVESLRTAKESGFDRHYLEMMRRHHRLGVDLTNLARERAQNIDVRNYALKAAFSQQKDVEEITELLDRLPAGASTTTQTRTGTNAPGGTRHEQLRTDLMGRLEAATGAAFDRAFVETMTRHEKIAFELAGVAEERAAHRAVEQFAMKSEKLREMQLEQLEELARLPVTTPSQ